MYIIDQEGTGDFTSIQAAIDAAPANSLSPVILLVRPGEYHERVIVDKDNIRLVGSQRDRVIIACSACAKVSAPWGFPQQRTRLPSM